MTEAALNALAAQSEGLDFELLIADNGSTDETRAVAEQWADRLPVRVIDASARRGQAAAMNTAALEARGDLIVFTDADDIPLPGWLEAWCGLDCSIAHASGPVVWFGYDEPPPSSGAGAPARLPEHMGYMTYALGTNFAIRREWLKNTGGFDEGLPPAQDIDLSWRLQLEGVELVFIPRAVLAKRERRGVRDVIRQYYHYGVCDPVLYRRYRDRGVPKPKIAATIKTYGGLLVRLPLLFDRRQRVRWARQVGRRAGRAIGSIRARVLYL